MSSVLELRMYQVPLVLGLSILVLHFFAHMENEYVHAGFQVQLTTTGVGKWYVPSMYHTKSSLVEV